MTAALIKRMLYLIATVSSVAIIFVLGYCPKGVTLLAATILFANITFETTLLRRTQFIAAIGAAASIFICISALLEPWQFLQLIFLAIVTGGCAYAVVARDQYAYQFFAVNFLTIMTMYDLAKPGEAIHHATAIAVGVLVTALMQIFLLPYFMRDEYRQSESRVYHRFSRLTETIFSCLKLQEYPDNIYLFERRIHKQKIKCLHKMELLASRVKTLRAARSIDSEMQTCFEIILDVGQIRRRVTDHTIFELCGQEIAGVEAALLGILNTFASRGTRNAFDQDFVKLEQHILQFENSFEHILKVTAREPLVFILFFAALKTLLLQFRGMVDQSCGNAAKAQS